jgi:hypothetical protein
MRGMRETGEIRGMRETGEIRNNYFCQLPSDN